MFLMKSVMDAMKMLWAEENAAAMAEYALLVALIAMVCFGAVVLIGKQVFGLFNSVPAF